MIDELSDYRIPKMSPMVNRKTVRGKMVLLNFSLIYIIPNVKFKFDRKVFLYQTRIFNRCSI
uniref:Uncharacterized protein n=1 Tax=Candidatus Methanophaga sp. ANME-1 ERB7 TaxID=2759913 RepID=A0A7G9ZB83_9EURY|nr:hypothetical protein PKDJNKLE_00003 [Methanosarcinales archaeon ANME-1 ERB7]